MWGLPPPHPLFEEETYRKVCRMGRDVPFSAKMNHAHLHQEGILGHPSRHVPMALFLQVSSSLAPMQVCWRMLHCPAAKPRVATGQGREVFFPRHRCSVERTEGLMFFCLVISIYIYCYCVIQLYTYISILLLRCLSIVLFVYCFIACLKHGSIAFFISIFYFCSLLRPLFFYDSGCRLSIIWLFTVQRYGGSVRYQTPGDALFG